MVRLQIATLALTLALQGVALPPLRSLHKTPDSKGRGAAAAETLTKSELDGLIKQLGVPPSGKGLLLDVYALLTGVTALGCPGPGLSAGVLKEKLSLYFGKPPKLQSEAQLKLLRYTLKWLCDNGLDLGGVVRRGPIASATEAVRLAEDWVFGEFIRSEFDVDILHQAAIQQIEIPKEKLPLFLDYLARSGRLQSLTQKVLQGPHGKEAFQANRDYIEAARLKSLDPAKLDVATRKQLEHLSQKVSDNAKKDIGVFLSFGDLQDDFMKTREGLQIRGEPYHPFDADKAWKKTYLKDSLKDLNLDPKVEEGLIRDFVEIENYPVGALKRLGEFVRLLATPKPQGLGLSKEKQIEKIDRYRRLPPKDPRGVERMTTAWRMANTYAPSWVQKGSAIFERDLFTYASAEEFNRFLSIVDLYASISKRETEEDQTATVAFKAYVERKDLHSMTPEEFRKQSWGQQKANYLKHLQSWRRHYESLSPLSWRGDPEKVENLDSRPCKEQIRRMVEQLPRLRADEVAIAIEAICKGKVPEMLEWYNAQRKRNALITGRYRDLQGLLDRAIAFVAASEKDLGDLAAIDPQRCKESDFHAARCLSNLKKRAEGIAVMRAKAEYLLLALRTAEVDPLLKDGTSLESVRSLADRLARMVDLSKSISGPTPSQLEYQWDAPIEVTSAQAAKQSKLFSVGFCSELPDGVLKWGPKGPPQGTDSPPSKDGGQSSEQSAFDAGVYQRNEEYKKQHAEWNNFLVKEIEGAAGREKAFVQAFDQRNKASLQTALAASEVRATALGHQVARQRALSTELMAYSEAAQSGRSDLARQSQRFRELENIIQVANPSDEEGRANLEMARLSRDAAALAGARGDSELAGHYGDIGTVFARVASGITDHKRLIIGLTPGVGLAQDFLELVTGFDVDGNGLDGFDRGFAALGVLTGGLGSKLKIPVKAAVEILQARRALSGGTVPKAIDAATRALETNKFFVEGNNVKRAFKVEKLHNTDVLNAEKVSAGRQPPYASGTTAADVRTIRAQKFVRVYAEEQDRVSDYIVRSETISGKSAEEIKGLLNLKNTPKLFSDVSIPENALLRRSLIGKNKFGDGEGKVQYQILGGLDPKVFGPSRPIELLKQK